MSEMMLIPKADLVAGYNAIRAKGVAGQIKSGQLADKISSIPSGSGKPEQAKSVKYTSNGTRVVRPDAGNTLSQVTVEVAVPTSGGIDTTTKNPAVAGDIIAGMEAFANGKKIIGAMNNTINMVVDSGSVYAENGTTLVSISNPLGVRTAVEKDGAILTKTPLSLFGDASASNVAKGKTFTSASGYKVVGTMGTGGGGLPDVFAPGDFPIQSIPAPSLSSTTAGEVTKSTSISVKKTGDYKIKAIVECMGRDSSGDFPTSVRLYHGRAGSATAVGDEITPTYSLSDPKIVLTWTAHFAEGEDVWLDMKPGKYSQAFGGPYTNRISCLSLSLCIDWNPI